MHAQRTAVAIAAGVGMICTFLPWVSTPFGSVDGTKGDGRITLAICGAALVSALSGDRSVRLSRRAREGCALFGLAAGGIAIWKIVDFKNAMAGTPVGGAFGVGIGLYVLVAAGAGVAFLPEVVKGDAPPPPPPPESPASPPTGT